VLNEIADSGDALTKKTFDSFSKALNITKIKTDGTDAQFIEARRKYFKL